MALGSRRKNRGTATYLTVIPPGVTMEFAGNTAPEGWLLCDGSTHSRSEFASLFNTIGTLWGEGDGSTTFHVPDMRGRTPRGRDAGAGRDNNAPTRTASNSGGATGDAVGSVQGDATKLPNSQFTGGSNTTGAHTHTWSHLEGSTSPGDENNSWDTSPSNAPAKTYNTGPSGNHSHSVTVTGGGDAETRTKNAYFNYIIKV